MNTDNKSLLDHCIVFFATGFYSGYFPKAPGTIGSVVAFAPFILLSQLQAWLYLSILTLAIVIGIYLCDRADRVLGSHDNKSIVWDEFCGMWITLFMLPEGWHWLLIGFVLFRFFDIVKPYPISVLDKHVKGGLGVMIDDVLAGVFALIIIQLLAHFALIPSF